MKSFAIARKINFDYIFRLRVFISTSTQPSGPSLDRNSLHCESESQTLPLLSCVKEIDVGSPVTCIQHSFTHVYVGLESGKLFVFELRGDLDLLSIEESVSVLNLSNHSVRCMIVAGDKLWCACHNMLFVVQLSDLTEKV